MDFSQELQACLNEFVAGGPLEIRENGGRATSFSGVSWEVRGAVAKPLLHLWSENYNLTRRVLAITEQSDERLALAVERFGRNKPDRLEFVRLDVERSARELSRNAFCSALRSRLPEWFADESIESISTSADLEHSISGNYVRGLLRRGSSLWALLAVPGGESAAVSENSLTFGLLWLDHARKLQNRGTVRGLRLILPKDAVRRVIHRAAALDAKLPIEFFEHDPVLETLERISLAAASNLETRLVPHRQSQALLDAAQNAIDPVVSLSRHAISVHPSPQSGEVWLRFRGLAFARWDDGCVYFGLPEARTKLTASSKTALKDLVQQLANFRHPLAVDTRHALYRAQPERWLEAIVRHDVSCIDASLDSRFVYSQVFARVGGEHGILDLLTVNRSGRLAILELKAGEHIHLPLQAADYWLRIRKHLEDRDFARYGYFPGIELQPLPPLVYLVAPAIRFHPSTETLLSHLTPELEIIRVGISESWRRGVRVIMRR